ncbi:NAD-dependent deacylase [Pseudomonas sp. BN414]|uniref:SIR2 family NAD-dependent protein deacylase n=1 Tax=Pseudomonas sp. BN414 TaxID=2567888 RepID=UPI0024566FEB|nr:NAD-dependent deacylase [Pseudomonas sp. BN414]MDH4565689.1 NAD-dependent deacylase [Pseudomonas sp. BN414]
MTRIPDDLVSRLRNSRHLLIFTGAGVSAESGIPTFRDAQTGLWAKYRPEELASPEGFQADPQTVWDWYAWRRERCLAVPPNPAHQAIAELQRRLPKVTLITQNVDGLHQRAGSSAPLELHGTIHRLKCFKCQRDGGNWPEDVRRIPRCECGGLLRPAVVWFGESLPEAVLEAAAEASQDADLFLSIGTSSLVYPAAELPFLAKRHGAYLVEINPQPTPLSARADLCLQGAAGEVMAALLATAWAGSQVR